MKADMKAMKVMKAMKAMKAKKAKKAANAKKAMDAMIVAAEINAHLDNEERDIIGEMTDEEDEGNEDDRW